MPKASPLLLPALHAAAVAVLGRFGDGPSALPPLPSTVATEGAACGGGRFTAIVDWLGFLLFMH